MRWPTSEANEERQRDRKKRIWTELTCNCLQAVCVCVCLISECYKNKIGIYAYALRHGCAACLAASNKTHLPHTTIQPIYINWCLCKYITVCFSFFHVQCMQKGDSKSKYLTERRILSSFFLLIRINLLSSYAKLFYWNWLPLLYIYIYVVLTRENRKTEVESKKKKSVSQCATY